MKKLFAILPLVVFLFASSMNAQGESDEVVLPDLVIGQVVRKIVIEHFKSKKGSEEIYLAERGIKREWLPKMEKIRFTLVSESDVDGFGQDVHFFKQPRLIDGKYEIDFGWGDPGCNATGDTWQFEIVGGALKGPLRTSGGWGMGCGPSVN